LADFYKWLPVNEQIRGISILFLLKLSAQKDFFKKNLVFKGMCLFYTMIYCPGYEELLCFHLSFRFPLAVLLRRFHLRNLEPEKSKTVETLQNK